MQRMDDFQVKQEMDKMVAFIKQEAFEKAKELKIKADEEFNIEKGIMSLILGKLVNAETVAIESFISKKVKQAEVSRKMYFWVNKVRPLKP
jgi:V-type H+-transporting ATPase subunit E